MVAVGFGLVLDDLAGLDEAHFDESHAAGVVAEKFGDGIGAFRQTAARMISAALRR